MSRRHRFLILFRRFSLVVALAAVLWIAWRFQLKTLPMGANSPLLDLPPGARMLVDLHPRPPEVGDVLFFRDTDGSLLLGRVVEPPPGLTSAALDALAEGALWIEGDTPGLALRDSRLLGPIPFGAIEGRMLLFLSP